MGLIAKLIEWDNKREARRIVNLLETHTPKVFEYIGRELCLGEHPWTFGIYSKTMYDEFLLRWEPKYAGRYNFRIPEESIFSHKI